MSTISREKVLSFLKDLVDQAAEDCNVAGTTRWKLLEEAIRLVSSAPPDDKGWRIDDKDSNRAYIKLTEHHELCVNFTGEGIILDNVDQRLGDVVDTRCLDLEDLNCVMDEEEL